jgi:ATP-binding cassette subfamily B protein
MSKFQSLFADRYGTPAMVRRLLTEHAFAHRRLYAIAFVLMGVSAAATAISTYLLGDIINQAYVHRNFAGIVAVGLLSIGVFVIRGVATYGHAVLLSRIANKVVASNQRQLFGKLMREDLGFFADRHSSEFIARLTTGASSASQALNLLITAVGRDLFTLIGLLTVMFVQDPIICLITLVVVPPALIVLRKLIRRIRSIAKKQFDFNAGIIETMQEALQGIRVVKAFTLEDEMKRRLDASVQNIESESNKWARVANRASPLMETLGGMAIAGAIIYGGYRVVETGATPGEFFSFIAAFLLALPPAKHLARLNIELNSHLVGVRMLFEILDNPAGEPDDSSKPALALTDARVEFADVRFAYRADEPVLHGMSFIAEPGRTTALVGPSGGGKSTVLNLILRFYEIDSGAITIDAQNIAGVSRESLRRQIAFVGQNVHLFRGTVRDNIVLGKLGASDAEIVAAAKAAHAHDFIMGFPAGYDTPVGEHGFQLSGGQRQRVSIARALIKDAPIILLDEATAALDSESERHVQEAIAELCKGRTTIVIAHRLSTVMHADRILVVEAGQIVESGRHEELLRKGGRYASFYRLQLRDQDHAPVVEIASIR